MSAKSNPSRSLLETLESRRLLSVTVPDDYVLVQGDIAVDSDGTPTQTGIILDSGANYFVKAKGTYTIAPGRLADAEFMQENSAGHPWIKGVKGRPLVAGVTDWGNTRDTSTTPEYGGFFTGIPAAGEGATGNEFTPRLNDSYYNDNAGGLMVELYRQIPTVTIEPAIEAARRSAKASRMLRHLSSARPAPAPSPPASSSTNWSAIPPSPPSATTLTCSSTAAARPCR